MQLLAVNDMRRSICGSSTLFICSRIIGTIKSQLDSVSWPFKPSHTKSLITLLMDTFFFAANILICSYSSSVNMDVIDFLPDTFRGIFFLFSFSVLYLHQSIIFCNVLQHFSPGFTVFYEISRNGSEQFGT